MNDFDKLPPEDFDLKSAILHERKLLEKAEVPILTISATFRKELAERYSSSVHTASDVVFSRAHYSMAEAVREAAEEMGKTTYLSDPTNFVRHKDWVKVEFTEATGQLIARSGFLKWLKDMVDTVVRNKLPIEKAVLSPTKYLSEGSRCPIISLYYEVGNILIREGRRVIQVVTDPHVRPQYLNSLPSKNVTFCLFDEETKKLFIEEAKRQKKTVEDEQLVVTGPPIDPRICRMGDTKKSVTKGEPVNIGICTGGLGTNLNEIKRELDLMEPPLKPPRKVKLFLYAGTHRDFRNFFEDYAAKLNVRIGNLDDETSDIRILYEDSIIDANNNLIKYLFPWAHVVITKPSGDMAYDAAAAGCFLLLLEPWGPWEENIRKRFLEWKIAYDLSRDHNYQNILAGWRTDSKMAIALENSHALPKIFREGATNIVLLQQRLKCS